MKERKVRLFISSTFRDMNAERDYLNNYVFPQIKQYCEDRYIEFTPIDLRWGVTEEERRNGLVIASCMEEVDNARPFFIGILGERYGWMPDIDDLNCDRPVITQNQEWLLSMLTQSASITEIEMDYAALDNNNVEHALFFIKADDVELPADFCEETGSHAHQKLQQLKEKIRKQKKYPVHSYHTPKEVGGVLLQELKKMIDIEFPPSKDDYLTSIINRHEYSLQQHAFSLFDTTNDINEYIDEWTKRGKWVFFMTGPNGIGTSNQLAHLVLELRKRWSAHEKIDHKRIIYYDFEYANSGISYFDDFLHFLSLIKEPIRMVAIDNASLLDINDAERLWDWVRNTKTRAIITATHSPFANMMQCNANSTNLTIHKIRPEQSKSLIVNYPKLYGKQLTDQQIDKIMQCKYIGDPTILTLLMSTLVRFGSMEQLDKRIDELIQETDKDIFFHLIHEHERIFNEEKLAVCFAKALIAIAMHNNHGISETDLIDLLHLSLAEWAIVRPIVFQFCHNNTQRLSFIKNGKEHNWARDIKIKYDTYWIGALCWRSADWWYKQEGRDLEKYTAILDIYNYGWHLPYPDKEEEDFKLFTERAKSLLLSPKSVILLRKNELASYYPHFNRVGGIHMWDKPSILFGNPIEKLSSVEQEQYYTKLAEIALSTIYQNSQRDKNFARNNEAAFCYRQIAKLKTIPHEAHIYEAKALLAEHKADMAIKSVSTFWGGVKGNPKEQLDKRLIRLEGYLQKNYMDRYYPEILKAWEIVEKNKDKEIPETLCILSAQACYQMTIYGVKKAREAAIYFMNKFARSSVDILAFSSPFFYYMNMMYAIHYIEIKDWEKLYYVANQAFWHAFYIYGDGSYQIGRTNILYNYAYAQVNGKFADTNGYYNKNFVPWPYRQVIDANLSDRRTRNSVAEENAFYENLVREINSIIKY